MVTSEMGVGIFLKIDFCVENFNIKFNKKILIISIFASEQTKLDSELSD